MIWHPPTAAAWVLLPALLVVTSLGPGLLCVRRFRGSALERLCLAVAISLFVTYLFTLVRFILQLPAWTHVAFSLACAVSLVLCLRDARRLLRSRSVRRTLLAYALLLLWTLMLLAMVRHYSGAFTSVDWHVHYDKAVFFARSSPSDPSGGWLLDRPPGANLIWSHLIAQVGLRFDLFQVTCAFVATLTLLPCCLLAPALLGKKLPRPRGRPNPLLVAALLAVCPLFVQNATYTWTKLPAVFCTILGLSLYLKGMRRNDTTRLALAFACFAFGCLAHYTAVPFALFAMLHYLARGRWNSGRWWLRTAVIGLCGAGVLATWYGWTAVHFGVDANVASNPSVRAFGKGSIEDNVARAARNAVGTIVPHVFRKVGRWFPQPNRLGYVRDHAYTVYSGNIFATVGAAAGILVAYLLWRALAPLRPVRASSTCFAGGAVVAIGMMYVPPARNVLVHALPTPVMLGIGLLVIAAILGALCRNLRGRAAFSPQQRFWRGLIVVSFVVSVGAWDAASDVGIAHICMQPLAYMGVTLLATHLPAMPLWFRALALLGMAFDFALGILLHFTMQRHTFAPGAPDPGLIKQAELNWQEKQAAGFTFLGDHFAWSGPALPALLVVGALVAIWYVAATSSRNGQRRNS